jgi:hypothetical protein
MGFFDFFKKKPDPIQEMRDKMFNQMFPKGDKDILAATNQLLNILNHSIPLNEAKSIITKSYIICLLASEKDKFDKERLKLHLSGYCIQHFDEKQLDEFYNYIMAINSARIFSGRTPSEVRKQGDTYLW